MARPSKLYLVCYNFLQALGWFVALLRLLPCLAPPVSVHSAYAVAGDLICTLLASSPPSLPLSAVSSELPAGIGAHSAASCLFAVGWEDSLRSRYSPANPRVWTMYQALPFVKKRNLYSGFFKKFSMSYHSFIVIVLVSDMLLAVKQGVLYMHVFKQRKSKLGKGSRKKRA
ncbi:very-long-chain (3R)-3-hydroxyacyl-CoA dehydratase 2 isoform X1 [Panicum miliaceum]|uniref:Very-long-chain (3R)-3-hydroxyacyl-CoA dehydratase n=1 Tax=Panicum miliaceum TaxID=4540 RepID=A0A3L6T236_PANMI|nr:very-long-chain (3R)-3-hydroxyacyl-CoA dehydratase 2 isoform X1 [Panicum miliaceum]